MPVSPSTDLILIAVVIIVIIVIIVTLFMDSSNKSKHSNNAYLVEINKPPPVLIIEYDEPYDELNYCVPNQDNLYCSEGSAPNIGKIMSEHNIKKCPCDPIARKIMGMTSIEKMTEKGIINVYDQHAQFTAEKAQSVLYAKDCEVIKPKELFVPDHLMKEGDNYMNE